MDKDWLSGLPNVSTLSLVRSASALHSELPALRLRAVVAAAWEGCRCGGLWKGGADLGLWEPHEKLPTTPAYLQVFGGVSAPRPLRAGL